MDFHPVEENLRQSFRALASGRAKASVLELPGVTIASLGVRFQMFNAAFFSSPVEGSGDLTNRVQAANEHFSAEGRPWSLWVCEDWLSWTARRRLSRICGTFGLRIVAELPGMVASELSLRSRPKLPLEIRRLTTQEDLAAFRKIGSDCFRVPSDWFSEVFSAPVLSNRQFECWIARLNGEPVATAATVPCGNAIGMYNIATVAAHRGRGIAQSITRHAALDARRRFGPLPLVLQSTPMGLGVYQRLGFHAVTRVLAYVSGK